MLGSYLRCLFRQLKHCPRPPHTFTELRPLSFVTNSWTFSLGWFSMKSITSLMKLCLLSDEFWLEDSSSIDLGESSLTDSKLCLVISIFVASCFVSDLLEMISEFIWLLLFDGPVVGSRLFFIEDLFIKLVIILGSFVFFIIGEMSKPDFVCRSLLDSSLESFPFLELLLFLDFIQYLELLEIFRDGILKL